MFGLEFMCESMMAVFKYLKYCHRKRAHTSSGMSPRMKLDPLTRAIVSHFRSMSKQ